MVKVRGKQNRGKLDRKDRNRIKEGAIMAQSDKTGNKTEADKTEPKQAKQATQATLRKHARKTFGEGCIVNKAREVVYRYRVMIPQADGNFIVAASTTAGIDKALEQIQEFATKNPKLIKNASK